MSESLLLKFLCHQTGLDASGDTNLRSRPNKDLQDLPGLLRRNCNATRRLTMEVVGERRREEAPIDQLDIVFPGLPGREVLRLFLELQGVGVGLLLLSWSKKI